MKRTTSARAPSPTNTTYSGISNYRTDQYKPLRDKVRTPSVPVDPKAIASVHYEEMATYLENHLAKEPANARASAREKLTRLTRQQFQELSTDVYDELLRRRNNAENEVPFLPVRDDFHPKRNQARQKLATLPKTRFKDLSGDVFHELGRRYPEFKEPETLPNPTSPTSSYDDSDFPSPDFPQSSKDGSTARPAPTDSGYAASSRRPSEDTYRRPSEENYRRRLGEDAYGNRSEDSGYGGGRRASEDNFVRDSFAASSRRKPSQDIVFNLRNEENRRPSPDITLSGRKSGEDDRELARRPSGSISTASDSTNATNAQREVIIPNKSTIAEEDIERPDTDGEGITDNEPANSRSPRLEAGVLGGLSGLSARLRDRPVEEDDEDGWPGAGRSGEEYFDKLSFGRASVASDRSMGISQSSRTSAFINTGRMSKTGGSFDADLESLRREYEYKIATMQNRLAGLERSLEDAEERERRLKLSVEDGKVEVLEEELKAFREKGEEQDATLHALRKELDDLREGRLQEQDAATRRAQEDKEEIQILEERCERLETELTNAGSGADIEAIEQLRSDLEGLLSELADLSHRNDELMIAKDSDLAIIHNLDTQLKDYKRKYETAKTELRSFKATSQLLLQASRPDTDQLPVSTEGGLLDIHVTAFMTATDSLLTAGRSNAPSRVLAPMKAVVNAVTAIIEDVRSYERRHNSADVEIEGVHALRERAEATLSNLVTASKTHATSMGMSPVSLLDAASSHLSATVTELGKIIFIRKASAAEQEQFALATRTNSFGLNGFAPTLRSIDEMQYSSTHQRTSSSGSRKTIETLSFSPSRYPEVPIFSPPPVSTVLGDIGKRRPVSPTSSAGSSPPPLFDQSRSNVTTSDDSAVPEGPDEAWVELKPYLEAQSEAIVCAIPSVLSGARSSAPTSSLNENLTQIITIVSSIVAVCKDSLPPSPSQRGRDILRELSDNANKLSEVQNLREVTKESRQVMAKSSLAIANAMKGLMKL
ncbi:hypothetical protein EW145_g7419 [Phellinidium pouzarii]|uniref:GIT Spa2 homology (SHD) domain-containing protein n=1 Tax=Phellinidium pouzarii TaxID=167371 RepID=A0A4S4KKJ1_9AGAM|nr:hypothetical protein EW145_g7419 [Phellinidium pouzarii]